MIECIFTIDYEIYGNGAGSLRDLVFEPACKLKDVFDRHGVKFVNFVEVAEFEQIESHGTDPASADVRRQIRELHHAGYETALHLHPQWSNARHHDGHWELDYAEYNLCTLPSERIAAIVDRALGYLRNVVEDPQFTPLSFRAGNWLFQPTRAAAAVLTSRGLKIDSSVFKGGRQHVHHLDYRPALKNGYYWRFRDDVNVEIPAGPMLEIPIYSQMVPFWRMLTGKRVALHNKGQSSSPKSSPQKPSGRISRLRDYLRPMYPLKFDFCRMTLAEMTSLIEHVSVIDRSSPEPYRPLVAIGHTKDLVDLESVDAFLGFLKSRGIAVTTLAGAYSRCQP
jgi:hypothetical protein